MAKHSLQSEGGEKRFPHNLPTQPTPLVGRQAEVEAVAGLLGRADVPLLTLTGPGGIGKTRLALRVASELLGDFSDGVFLVPLAPLHDPELIVGRVAQAVGVREGGEGTLLEQLKEHLRGKQLLLLLDNFEHLMSAAPLVAELIALSPYLKVLVTSRAALRLSGEHVYPVPPLKLPESAGTTAVELQALARVEAVKLFLQRSQAVRPGFGLTSENAAAVAQICRHLDGLPLAIELAAARSKLLPPAALLSRLQHRLDLLTDGARDLPARQRTLRAALDWSFQLLSDSEKRLFRRVSVFSGGASLEAIEEVCGFRDEQLDTFTQLAALVDQSMIGRADGTADEPRFWMLETVREYALERLEASGEEDEFRRVHATYFATLVERADIELKGAERKPWLNRLEAEHDNIRVALRWAIERREVQIALQLAAGSARFWDMHAHFGQGRRWLEATLMLGDEPENRTLMAAKSRALQGASLLAIRQGDWDWAAARSEESLQLCRQLDDQLGVADALNQLAVIATFSGAYTDAEALHQVVLSLRRELDDALGAARTLHNLGLVIHYQNRFEESLDYFQQALLLFRELGVEHNIAITLNMIGWTHDQMGDTAKARSFFEESLRLNRELNDRFILFDTLQGLADVVQKENHPQLAAKLLSASDSMRRKIGAVRSTHCDRIFERLYSHLRTVLDEISFSAEWDMGQSVTLDELEGELSRQATAPRPAAKQHNSTGLTGRELEVLELLASGLSDKGIAQRLEISPATVSKHVANVLGKTVLKNRTELTRWALAQGLAGGGTLTAPKQ